MTLVGLLPPLCDNGQLLVDGGYSTYQVKHETIEISTHPPIQLTIYLWVQKIL